MSNCVVFVANGMSKENVRLQPWRYLYELANKIASRDGYRVVIVTEGEEPHEEDQWGASLYVVRTCLLSVRRQTELMRLIESYRPCQLWWSVTPRTIAYWRMLKSIGCDKYALVTCPLYEYWQLIKATLSGVPFSELGALWKQRLIPRKVFADMLREDMFLKVFAQSEANLRVLERAGVQKEKLRLLRVGIDPGDREPVPAAILEQERQRLGYGGQAVTFLYFGAVRKIRGFDALIKAFAHAAGSSPDIRLVVLARGADDGKLQEIADHLARTGLTDRVSVLGGWLSREQVWAHVESCDVVVLPFVIVPSDIPIAILEAMARGKPVIGTNVDGIPELVADRGMLVDPLDPRGFARVIERLAQDQGLRARLGSNALEYMRRYPDWDCVGRQALDEARIA